MNPDASSTKIHIPVLCEEVLTYLDPQPGGIYLDVTFGAGGHTKAILEKEPTCKVIAFDWDKISLDTFFPPLREKYGERIEGIWGNFAHLYKLLKKYKIAQVDGILADFGTSYMQIFDRSGFSFGTDTPLDMRMSPAHHIITAAMVVNEASQQVLEALLYELGEERFARRIVRAILQERQRHPIETTAQLVHIIKRAVPHNPKSRINPATKTFQALRMYVNKEIENIQSFLPVAANALRDGGRLVCISFHSGEDRLMKEFFKKLQAEGAAKILTKKVITASEDERKINPSARSAKLRAVEIIAK